MLALTDIRSWVESLRVSGTENVYIGKLDDSKQQVIGVYGRPSSGAPHIALGGLACTTYATRKISILLHWNRSKPESEAAAFELYEKLLHETENKSLIIGETRINRLHLEMPEPKDIGQDKYGVYEYVIWLLIDYERRP